MTVGELKEFLKDVSDDTEIDFVMRDTSRSMVHHNLNPIFGKYLSKESNLVPIGVSVDIDEIIEDRRYDTVEADL